MRSDRLGDTILTLPCAEAVKRLDPSAHVAFLTRAYAGPLLDHHPHVDEPLVDAAGALERGGGWRALLALARRIRAGNYDLAVVFRPEWRANLAVALAGVPRRVSPAVALPQFFANVRVRQRRSRCRIHECDYNLDLVRRVLPGLPRAFPKLHLSETERRAAETLRAAGPRPLVGIHPGSGGSAANWPPARYVEAARALAAGGAGILLTWGPGEEALRDRFLAGGIPGLRTHERPLPLRDLLSTLAALDLLVSPSTGPLHAAVALGVPVVGLYSPVLACSPVRWGPHPAGAGDVLMPAAGPCDRCPGATCPRHDCMSEIQAAAVVERATARLKERRR